nr:hypothetical protein [Tanacetum cinerariifolium]
MQQLCYASKYPMLTRMQDSGTDLTWSSIELCSYYYCRCSSCVLTIVLENNLQDNPFIAKVNIEIIESFMNMVGYQRVVDKYPSISSRIEEDYHSIKDDIPLVSVYTTGNMTVRGMLIPDAFLTDEIPTTDDYKEYEMVFVGVAFPMNQPRPIVSTQGTYMTTPRAHMTPTLTAAKSKTTFIPPPSDDRERERDEIAEATLLSLTLYKIALATEEQENVAKVQEKLAEEEIEKMVKGEEDC